MRIAVYHNLPSGGGKRALYEQVRGLSARHELDVYTLSCANHDFCDLRPYVRRHVVQPFSPLPLAHSPFGRLNQGIRAVDLWRLGKVQKQLADQIDAQGYHAVLVGNCQYSTSPALLQFLQTPSVYYCEEPPRIICEPRIPRPYTEFSRLQQMGNWFDPFPGVYRRTLARLDKASALSATSVLVNSAYSRESLYRAYGINAHVAYLGVDLKKFQPLGIAKGNFVLSVGAIHPLKGFDFLLHSLALIEADRRPRLCIVGNAVFAQEHAYLEKLADDLGVQVTFRTEVSDGELLTLYNQALFTVYAPVMEPFGFVSIESMACGTPVVGVREGGLRETVLDGETGILTDRDPRQFAQAVKSLVYDQERRQIFGLRGRAYVEERWSWERSVLNLERRLRSVVGVGA